MKILHLSSFNYGGAAIVPKMIHEECLKRGHKSTWVVHRLKRENQNHFAVKTVDETLCSKMAKYLNRINDWCSGDLQTDPKYHFYNTNETRFHISARRILQACGYTPHLICIYWISGFINIKTIKSLWKITGANIRVFSTDMAFYTGGCHYSLDCEGYKKDCRICPAILSKQTRRAYKNLSTKKKNLKGLPIQFIASKGQSYRMAKEANLLIPFDIVPNVYKVSSKAVIFSKIAARKELGIPENRTILLIGSIHLKELRKGFSILLQSLEALSRNDSIDKSNLEIVIIGSGSNELSDRIPFPTRFLGYLNFETELQTAFQASDCFISSSIGDTGPYMINLSIYNQCPVIVFPVGVAKYLVGQKQAGIMARGISANCLTEAIMQFLCLSKSNKEELIAHCEKVASEELIWNEEVFNQLFVF